MFQKSEKLFPIPKMAAGCSLYESILNFNGEELDIPSKEEKCIHCRTIKDLFETTFGS